MACTPCYIKRIDNCAESVTIDGQLEPNTVYTWVITDRFGHEWSYNITTDADGSFEIDLTDPMFPAGLFNQFAALTLQVFLYADRCEPATMIFCETEFNCLTFSVGAGNYVYTNRPPDDECNCQFVETVTGTAVDNTDPWNPIINLPESGGIESVTGDIVDNTDPLNPIVKSGMTWCMMTLFQTGTSAPTVIAYKRSYNNINPAPTCVYNSVGNYTLQFAGNLFASTNIVNCIITGVNRRKVNAAPGSTTALSLLSFSDYEESIPSDDIVYYTNIMIIINNQYAL